MIDKIAVLALTAALGLAPPAALADGHLAPAHSKEITGFRAVGQETALWCWAASAQMILARHGVEISQTELATARANRKYRSPGEPPVRCDEAELARDRKRKQRHRVCYRGGWPEFDAHGFTFDERHCGGEERRHCALSWEELKAEVDADRPFAFVWDLKQTGSHMMVVFGYLVVPDGSPEGSRWVWVADPMPPGEGDIVLIPWEHWRVGPYGHRRDLFNIRPAGTSP